MRRNRGIKKTKSRHDNARAIRRGEGGGGRGTGGVKDGVDVLLLVPGSGNALLIVSLDPSPDSSLP